jgi:hypothetical protein
VVVERLRVRVLFAWAFHAREVRLERDAGQGRTPAFPETFSFHLDRHDPVELQLQLEDLWSNPRRIDPRATRRDAEELTRRLLAGLPAYLEAVLDRLEGEGRLRGAARERVFGDALVLARALERFLVEKGLESHPATRLAALHVRKLIWRVAQELVLERLSAGEVAARLAKAAPAVPSGGDVSQTALSEALAAGELEALAPPLLAVAERAFHRWLEDTCLDPDNAAFEGEDSPFAAREAEVLRAVAVAPGTSIRRGRDLSPFLRRAGNRDCARVLAKLEVWFLRQYDVYHAAALMRHATELARRRDDGERVLSRHSSRNYLLAIAVLLAPFLGAGFAYQSAPFAFDLACSAQVLAVFGAALWFLLVQFCWRKDLTAFRAGVPRIGAGIIVGYLPVFLIDEVWDLARRPWLPLGVVVLLLGFTTLLYLYTEVQRRIEDPHEAFVRARRIFFLGVLQALALGFLMTSLLGRFMVARTWEGAAATLPFESLRASTPPLVGELPRILGVEPVLAFPSAVLLMTFLSFFIGTFLQLMWEDLPITEPL